MTAKSAQEQTGIERPVEEPGRSKERSITFPTPPKELQKGSRDWKKLLAYFGPGAIVASVTLGSGETLFAPRGGAIFGLSIIWALVWAGLVKGIMTYSGVRYYTLTGEHVMSRWAKLPGPRGWFSLLMGGIAILAFPAWISGLSKMLGQIIAWIFGLPMTDTVFASIGTVLIVGTAGLVLIGGYDYVERAQIAIVAFLSATIAVLAIAAQPSLGGVLGGLVPHMPSGYAPFVYEKYPDVASRSVWIEVVTYMGAVGGGIYDYIGYVGYSKKRSWGVLRREDSEEISDFVRELAPGTTVPFELTDDNLKRAKSWLRAPQVDVIISFTAITFFTAAAMVLGAQSLHKAQLIPSGIDLYTFQARWFSAINPGLTILWKIGVFFAIFGTLYATWEGYTWTWLETVKPFSSRARNLERDNMTKARIITMIYAGGIGLVLIWSGLSAVAIVTPASIIGGVFGCGLWCWAMLWAERTALPEELRSGWALTVGLIISGVFLTGAGVISILEYLGFASF
ncbi:MULTISPECIES: Nramp family divalent metal transporter [unclassified Haladaptatus]|uniref:Nramp family divalent metal transporter n=1 Tax=unclassified Haladaptatus TaxID=2622732 RepID=UPI00209BDC3D|nr:MULTISPECIES: Nramp family divalent metal transporter [unclassified Haladaptatus]MCO8243792.1 Nramp family divalent metal transporter [Haladaptatus sp. AB643]MCO8256736.1 Nramp family divalent metal transporter [Haladaptatus sp. AB618]